MVYVWLSAEIPLDVLMKQYAGAYAEGFEWPQSSLQSDDDDMDDTEGVCEADKSWISTCISYLIL